MSEFPVSNLEKRLGWGIACGFCAMLLNIGMPISLLMIGIDPKWDIGPGMGLGLLWAAVILFCGSVGFVAGLVRPGVQAVAMTMGTLILMDIWMMTLSMRLYFISADIKVALMIIIIKWNISGKPAA